MSALPMLLLALPVIWWTGSVDAVDQVSKHRGLEFCVDAATLPAWKAAAPNVKPCASEKFLKTVEPGIDPMVNVASASRSPWINSNVWRFRRNPEASFLYVVPANKAVLAMAEANAYNVRATVQVSEDLRRVMNMSHFIAALPKHARTPKFDVSFVDDGKAANNEAMNLLSRRNILYQRVDAGQTMAGKLVTVGSKEFPETLLANPSEFAYKVRQWLGDDNRTIRIYGSENVLAYLTGDSQSTRIHLVNYTAKPLEGLRVRVKGKLSKVTPHIFEVPSSSLKDVSYSSDFAEFTIPLMHEYAVVDVSE